MSDAGGGDFQRPREQTEHLPPLGNTIIEAPMPQVAHPPDLLGREQPESPISGGAGRSYWQQVWRALLRPVAVRTASGYILFLVLLAVFVPLIANGRPYTVVIAARGGVAAHRTFPLFRSLTTVDLIIFIAAGAVLAALVAARVLHRNPDMAQRRRRQRIAMLACFAVGVAGAAAVYELHHNILDEQNYRRMLRHHQARDAIFAPVPWGYAQMEPLTKDLVYKKPYSRHWLGTDGNGRDVLSRLLWSARVVMEIGFISQVIALVIGVVVGALMGFFVGWTDLLGMRLVEIFESIPTFYLILIFVASYGRSLFWIMVILGLTGWSGVARFIRAEFFRIRKLDYVTAAIAEGLPLRRVLFRHMLPNGVTPVIVSMTFGIAGAVLSESGLSFLGVGVPPPTPSWGSMLNDAGNPASIFHWYLALAPGVLIFFTVLSFNLLGESLRDAIDPQSLS